MTDGGERLRIDKWLWAARFFKTRSLAAEAVAGGKVRVNGERPKPAKEIRPGDEIAVRVGESEWVVAVRAVAARRGPAADAQRLYEEHAASRAKRAEAAAARRAASDPMRDLRGRPTKRDRRLIRRFTEA